MGFYFDIIFILFTMKIGLVDSGIGVIPFIKSIIKHHINKDYYIFIDDKYFPYGEKTEEELLSRLIHIFNYFEKIGINQLLICCNTLSYIYMKFKISTTFKVETILSINISKKGKLLTTSYLSKKINSVDGGPLASLIESKLIKEIINFIKSIKEKEIILSCTHYPLIKSLFYIYDINALSYEDELISLLPSTDSFSINIEKKDYRLIRSYFKKVSINLIDN